MNKHRSATGKGEGEETQEGRQSRTETTGSSDDSSRAADEPDGRKHHDQDDPQWTFKAKPSRAEDEAKEEMADHIKRVFI